MDSRLGPTLGQFFLSFYEKNWLKNYPYEYKPVSYKRYVDDTFLLFRPKDHIENFQGYLNCQHLSIKFTSEIEENKSISFLDIKISRVLKALFLYLISRICYLRYYLELINYVLILNYFIKRY